MTSRAIASGVYAALEGYSDAQRQSGTIAKAIEQAALFDDSNSANLVRVDPDGETIIHFDVSQAVYAAAGVLGALVALAASPMGPPVAVAGVLSALGGLAGMKGLRQDLPAGCAHIVLALMQEEDKCLSRQSLRVKFMDSYVGRPNDGAAEFVSAVDRLQSLGAIRINDKEVKLAQRVLVRT